MVYLLNSYLIFWFVFRSLDSVRKVHQVLDILSVGYNGFRRTCKGCYLVVHVFFWSCLIYDSHGPIGVCIDGFEGYAV